MLFANYARRYLNRTYAEQDVVFCFSRNTDSQSLTESKNLKNDIIGLSCLNVPYASYSIPKDFHNFYNCSQFQRISYFTDTKNIIVELLGPPFSDFQLSSPGLQGESLLLGDPEYPRVSDLHLGPLQQAGDEGTRRSVSRHLGLHPQLQRRHICIQLPMVQELASPAL